MHKLALILISALSLASGSAFAASYQQIGGTIVDPILDTDGNVSTYAGPDLGPGAILTGANLFEANLAFAELTFADLSLANLTDANLNDASLNGASLAGAELLFATLGAANLDSANLNNASLFQATLLHANLTDASLLGASLRDADLSNANLSGATLAGAFGLVDSTGSALYDINTDFTGTDFDPVAAGWTLVPEPSTALLMGLGLAGLATRRRR
jgi:hypothetical protein